MAENEPPTPEADLGASRSNPIPWEAVPDPKQAVAAIGALLARLHNDGLDQRELFRDEPVGVDWRSEVQGAYQADVSLGEGLARSYGRLNRLDRLRRVRYAEAPSHGNVDPVSVVWVAGGPTFAEAPDRVVRPVSEDIDDFDNTFTTEPFFSQFARGSMTIPEARTLFRTAYLQEILRLGHDPNFILEHLQHAGAESLHSRLEQFTPDRDKGMDGVLIRAAAESLETFTGTAHIRLAPQARSGGMKLS